MNEEFEAKIKALAEKCAPFLTGFYEGEEASLNDDRRIDIAAGILSACDDESVTGHPDAIIAVSEAIKDVIGS